MKILYAIQATGNGHISRAMELLPLLEKKAKVDLFLSGANSTLNLDAPIKYRSNGLSLFYTCSGSLDYMAMFKKIKPLAIRKEVNDLPVEKYDLVINDFEYITSAACKKKKVPSIHFGHQASFQSNETPRPAVKNKVGEWVLKNYATASDYLGLHFCEYDSFILNPVIKAEIWNTNPTNAGHITVYLPSYCEEQLKKQFAALSRYRFQIFSRQTDAEKQEGNLTFLPVDKVLFNQSLIHCDAIVCGAGFETPAEALYLKKKILAIPIKGQYEQACNAAALEKLGVKILPELPANFPEVFESWYQQSKPLDIQYKLNSEGIIDYMLKKAATLQYR